MGSGLASGWSCVGSSGERSFSDFLLREFGVAGTGVVVCATWMGLVGVLVG